VIIDAEGIGRPVAYPKGLHVIPLLSGSTPKKYFKNATKNSRVRRVSIRKYFFLIWCSKSLVCGTCRNFKALLPHTINGITGTEQH